MEVTRLQQEVNEGIRLIAVDRPLNADYMSRFHLVIHASGNFTINKSIIAPSDFVPNCFELDPSESYLTLDHGIAISVPIQQYT